MFLRDLRWALRGLLLGHNRGYALASLLTLALGIGAATAVFSVAWAVLMAPLPYRAPERVLYLAERNLPQGLPLFSVSIPNFLSWREQATSVTGLAALVPDSANLVGGDGAPERITAVRASANLWDVLGQPLLAGRVFSNAEDTPPGAPVAILGEDLWRRRFNADPAIVGSAVRLNGELRTVVGIAPRDAGFATDVDVWLPLAPDPALYSRGDRRLDVVGRLAPGVDAAAARAEFAAISTRLAAEFPGENTGWDAVLMPVRDWIVGPAARERLLTLAWAVVVLLLVACTNVANLQIARATARSREIGVRQALGAGRARLVAQMAAENLILTAAGGALGIVVAGAAVRAAVAALPATTPRLGVVAFDWRIALLALVATGVCSIVFALAPQLLMMRRQLAAVLQQAGRTGAGDTRTPLRQVLVVMQFALATVLVVAAAVLAQRFADLEKSALGFRPDKLLVARLTLPQANEDVDMEPDRRLYAQLIQETATLPGVESAGIASEVPMGDVNTTSMRIAAGPGKMLAGDAAEQAAWRVVSADYLSTIGVPLIRGRWFDAQKESSRSMLLSEGLAKRLWPDGTDPVGQTVHLSNNRQYTVVGVVGDVQQRGLGEPATPTMYMSMSWIVLPTMNLVVRTSADPATLAGPLRDLARRVSPDHPLFDVRPMSTLIATSIAEPRVQTLLLLGFGGASLLLAALGIAGVMAYVVARRTPELAVRMALGASPRRVLGHMLGRGGTLCAAGVALGALALVPLSILARDSLRLHDFGVAVPAGAALLALAAIGLVACWLPTRRVVRIDPSIALRSE